MTIAVNRNLSNCENSPKKFFGASINWPASSVGVFIHVAQLGEHCSANVEATGSNPAEAPKNFFFGLFSQLLKLQFTAMVTYSFHLYSRASHHFIQCQKMLLHVRLGIRILSSSVQLHMRYRVEHEMIKFVSPSGHVILTVKFR